MDIAAERWKESAQPLNYTCRHKTMTLIDKYLYRLKTVLAQKNRNDRTELGPVQEPSAVGQVRDSANNQYQQLNWNLDNSSGTTYDKLQLQTPSTIAA